MKKLNFRVAAFTLVEIMIVVAIIGLLVSIAVPNCMRSRAVVQKNICLNNLRLTDAAVQLWAMDTGVELTAPVTPLDIMPYMDRGVTGSLINVFCPADLNRRFETSYFLTDAATRPTCRIIPATHFLY